MSSPPTTSSPRCPECGAAYRLAAERCWLCGSKLPQDGLDTVQPEEPLEATLVTRETASTFSLSSLFLVMTLVAVGAGVFAAAPGLGILFAIVATPALARTIVVTSRQKTRGIVTTPGQKAGAFLGSIGIVLLVFLSIGVALFTACWTACAGGAVMSAGSQNAVIAGAVAGGIAGLTLSGWVLWLIWRKRRKA
jgi:hypothetical protein